MADEQLKDVAQGVRDLEPRIDVFTEAGDTAAVARLAHAMAKVALRALEDAQTARLEAEQAVTRYVESQEEEAS